MSQVKSILKSRSLLFLLVVGIIFYGCDSIMSTNFSKSRDSNYYYFKRNLADNETFNQIIESSNEFIEFSSNSDRKNNNISLKKIKTNIRKSNNKQDLMNALSSVTNSKNKFYSLIEKKYKYQKKFIDQNPSFLKLTKVQQKELIKIAYLDKKAPVQKKKTKPDYEIPLIKSVDTEADSFGSCEQMLLNDIENCHDTEIVEAAFCGLLSPTLYGALACGAAVVIHGEICHDNANQDYETCKAYEE